jgi:hypothetical protein
MRPGQERQRRRRTTWTAGVRRALIVVCVFFIFQQITGIDVFPTGGRGRAAAIAAAVDWLANYALIEAFPAWHTSIGLGWVMVCFAVLCVVAIGFVYKFLPETKGLSVEEAVQVCEREAEGSGVGPLTGRPPTVSVGRA